MSTLPGVLQLMLDSMGPFVLIRNDEEVEEDGMGFKIYANTGAEQLEIRAVIIACGVIVLEQMENPELAAQVQQAFEDYCERTGVQI